MALFALQIPYNFALLVLYSGFHFFYELPNQSFYQAIKEKVRTKLLLT